MNGDSVYMALLTRLQIGILANETAEELAAALATWVGYEMSKRRLAELTGVHDQLGSAPSPPADAELVAAAKDYPQVAP